MRGSRLFNRSGLAAVGCLGVVVLAGCVEQFPDANTGSADFKAVVGHADPRSPGAAAIAFASIEAPEPIAARFRTALSAEAANRQITLTEPATARYLVRGYLDAYPTDEGTAIRYVWDVFDSTKHRTQRLDNGIDVPGSVSDPWSAVDDKVLSGMASRSAEDIAAYLATTPEATGVASASSTEPGPATPATQSH